MVSAEVIRRMRMGTPLGEWILFKLEEIRQPHHVPHLVEREDTNVLAVENSVAVGAYGNEVLSGAVCLSSPSASGCK